MTKNLVPAVVEAAIPVLGGLYATLLGFRKIGPATGQNLDYDRRHNRYLRWLKWGGPVVMAMGLAVFAEHLLRNDNRFEGADVQKIAAEMNAKMPVQVDDVTRCDRVEAGPDRTLSHLCTFSAPLPEQDKAAVQQRLTQQALANDTIQDMLSAGIVVRFKYFDAAGKPLLDFPITTAKPTDLDREHGK